MDKRPSLANKQPLQPFFVSHTICPSAKPIKFLDQSKITPRLVWLLLNDVVHCIQKYGFNRARTRTRLNASLPLTLIGDARQLQNRIDTMIQAGIEDRAYAGFPIELLQ
jgi:hypothetical protein